MITKEELLNYNFPPKIDFNYEENRLRLRNINQLQRFLRNVTEYPYIISDYEGMKPVDFKSKYVKLTNNEKIHDDCKNFIVKLNNYCENFNISRNYLIKKLLNDEAFASSFIVDFKKQNPYEPFVENYFAFLDKDIKLIHNFMHLPVSGAHAKYVYNGLICGEDMKKSVKITPPSVDFIWEYHFKDKKMNFYASHKYTQGSGTAQKNQMKDLEHFLDHSLQSASPNDYFIALMDGNYYTDYPYPNYVDNPKPKIIEHIKDTKQNKKCKVCTSINLIETLIELIEKWLMEKFTIEEIKEEFEKLEIIKAKIAL